LCKPVLAERIPMWGLPIIFGTSCWTYQISAICQKPQLSHAIGRRFLKIIFLLYKETSFQSKLAYH